MLSPVTCGETLRTGRLSATSPHIYQEVQAQELIPCSNELKLYASMYSPDPRTTKVFTVLWGSNTSEVASRTGCKTAAFVPGCRRFFRNGNTIHTRHISSKHTVVESVASCIASLDVSTSKKGCGIINRRGRGAKGLTAMAGERLRYTLQVYAQGSRHHP